MSSGSHESQREGEIWTVNREVADEDPEESKGTGNHQDTEVDTDIAHTIAVELGRPRYRRSTTLDRISTFSASIAASLPAPPPWATRLKSFIFPDPSDTVVNAPNYRTTPIVSGLVVPFSILLELPGLADGCYVCPTSGSAGQNKSPILEAGLAVSMACIIIANICLIARFMETKVRTSTSLAIAALTIHDAVNIIIISTSAVKHGSDHRFTFSKDFWSTVCSTMLSLTSNITLVVDFVRTPEFAKSGSGLTHKQRALVTIVMVFMLQIGFCALINSLLMGLSFLDALYFTVVTVETIGFGDIVPTTVGSRIFTIVFSTIGILNLGLIITLARDTIVEGMDVLHWRHVKALSMRKIYSRGRDWVSHSASSLHSIEAKNIIHPFEKRRQGTLPEDVETLPPRVNVDSVRRRGPRSRAVSFAEPNGNRMPLNKPATRPAKRFVAEPDRMDSYQEAKDADKMPIPREGLGAILETHEKHAFYAKLGFSLGVVIIFWAIGSVVFMTTEGWPFGIAVYFCFISFVTLGYGDYTPTTPAGRAAFIFWALLGVATMTILISVIGDAYSDRYKKAMHTKVYKQTVKRYRNGKRSRPSRHTPSSSINGPSEDGGDLMQSIPEASPAGPPTLEESRRLAQQRLEAFPHEFLQHARPFLEGLQCLVGRQISPCTVVDDAASKVGFDAEIPVAVRELLEEISASEGIADVVKKELLQDDDTRNALFMLSVDKSLRKMIEAAEGALATLADRDKLATIVEDGARVSTSERS
ncbi:hypothetical protein JAAARDRAFT_208252 [Jaapia argillacea MUCL 33604]|uniref:Potassium channel domain-containing protein n=1 Tax=Jaapia argillacea MUCL 33604 TaxID=933084 RepID=A0A067Q080_9AGAM|nr:hypothetical protein JAAARDRAFT_208252 [Jaapia argillacea MUCL 33604]